MALCPFARHRLLPENETQDPIAPTQVILHSAVDFSARSLWAYFVRKDVGVESHFYVRDDGLIEQYVDTEVKAHANRRADPRAISIETDDWGDPDNQPWTTAQVHALVRLLAWLMETHPGILPRVIPAETAAGIGYHSMFRRANGWSPWSFARGKTCPGRARIEQFPLIALAAANQHRGFSPQPTDEEDEVKLVRNPSGTRYYVVSGIHRHGIADNATLTRLTRRLGSAEVWADDDIDDLPAGEEVIGS